MQSDRVACVGTLALAAVLGATPRGMPAQANTTSPSGAGSDAHVAASSIRAARRSGEVRINGRLDDPAWQGVVPFSGFRQVDPHEGQPVSEATEARVLVDGDAIYVGVRLFDREPHRIQQELARRDESIDGDHVEVTIDSYHDHLTAFLFRLSPLGAKRDAAVSPGGGQDNSWDAIWDGAASVDNQGWTAEFRIPLSQLRYDPNSADHVWGLQIARHITRKGERAVFAFTPKTEQGGVHRYGHIVGLGRLPAPRRVELVPYALAKNEHPTAAPDDPFRNKNQIAPGVGVDMKYGITSNLTVDASFNPDFGQVEVDPAVVNLSAFETFFPERRPFFIEGANIFRFGDMRTQNQSNGYNFVHTRRIGRAPQRSLGSDYSFIDAPLETTIAGAAKLTGRARSGWSIGLLDAVTLREEARFRTAAGVDSSATVEPTANYFVGRIKRDLRGGNTTLGGGVTTVHRQIDDPSLEPLFRSAAYVGGFDWNHAWSNRRWAFDGAFALTHNVGSPESIDALQTSSARYYQRPDKERFRRDPTRTSLSGYVAELTVAKLAGKHWKGSVTYQEYSPGFEVNESGFLGSTDMRSIAPLIYYDQNTPGKYLRGWEQYLFWNPAWNFDGDLTFNGVGAITFFETVNFWDYFLRFDWRPPVIDDRLTRGGPVAGVPTSAGMQIEVESDRRKKQTFGVFASYMVNRAGGWQVYVGPQATIRPSSTVRLQLQPNYSRSRAIAQFVMQQVDPNATHTYGTRYVFATLHRHELAMTTRMDWTFTPNVSLQVFAQPLLAVGDFRDYKELARPRGFQFRVYGRDAGSITRGADGVYTVDPDGAGPSQSFTFDERNFNQRLLRGNAVLRWEYRPGSALFLVWQQSRSGSEPTGEFEVGRDFGELWRARPVNVFVAKATYWIGR